MRAMISLLMLFSFCTSLSAPPAAILLSLSGKLV
jgi:hypothetical protein